MIILATLVISNMKTNKKQSENKHLRGFSLMELVVAVAVIALIATIGFSAVNDLRNRSSEAKLAKDLLTLNAAADVYRASGGSLEGMVLPQEVLDKMKTTASDKTSKLLVAGAKGSFVDRRLRAVMATSEDSDRPRASWNPSQQRFELKTTGVGAIEFALDGDVSAIVQEDRYTNLSYGAKDPWIWDYSDVVAVRATPNVDVTISDSTPVTIPGGSGPSAISLPSPSLSIPSGTYPAADYPMTVDLTIPDEFVGVGRIYYQVDGGDWNLYTGGGITVPPVPLTTITAYTASNDPDLFSDSMPVSETYAAHFDTFSGGSDGEFENASGPGNMDIEYLNDGNRFEWGTEYSEGGFLEPNHVTFEGATFQDIEPEQEFLIGTMTYYNGTTLAGTTANTVELSVQLDLTSPQIQEELTFELSLESTINKSWQTADENADFVRLNNVASGLTAQLNGEQYYLVLSFGEHSAAGFTTIDQFHVHENATATGNLYGRFTTTPPSP